MPATEEVRFKNAEKSARCYMKHHKVYAARSLAHYHEKMRDPAFSEAERERKRKAYELNREKKIAQVQARRAMLKAAKEAAKA